MRTVIIEGIEHRLDCDALMPFYYSEQFLVRNAQGRLVAEDIHEAINAVVLAQDTMGIPPMLKMMQLFWAFERTTTPTTPGFKEWAATLPKSVLALNSAEWAEVVTDIVTECFFPQEASSDVGATADGADDAAPTEGA